MSLEVRISEHNPPAVNRMLGAMRVDHRPADYFLFSLTGILPPDTGGQKYFTITPYISNKKGERKTTLESPYKEDVNFIQGLSQLWDNSMNKNALQSNPLPSMPQVSGRFQNMGSKIQLSEVSREDYSEIHKIIGAFNVTNKSIDAFDLVHGGMIALPSGELEASFKITPYQGENIGLKRLITREKYRGNGTLIQELEKLWLQKLAWNKEHQKSSDVVTNASPDSALRIPMSEITSPEIHRVLGGSKAGKHDFDAIELDLLTSNLEGENFRIRACHGKDRGAPKYSASEKYRNNTIFFEELKSLWQARKSQDNEQELTSLSVSRKTTSQASAAVEGSLKRSAEQFDNPRRKFPKNSHPTSASSSVRPSAPEFSAIPPHRQKYIDLFEEEGCPLLPERISFMEYFGVHAVSPPAELSKAEISDFIDFQVKKGADIAKELESIKHMYETHESLGVDCTGTKNFSSYEKVKKIIKGKQPEMARHRDSNSVPSTQQGMHAPVGNDPRSQVKTPQSATESVNPAMPYIKSLEIDGKFVWNSSSGVIQDGFGKFTLNMSPHSRPYWSGSMDGTFMWDFAGNVGVQNQDGGKVGIVVSNEHRRKFSTIESGANVNLQVKDEKKIRITPIPPTSSQGRGAR